MISDYVPGARFSCTVHEKRAPGTKFEITLHCRYPKGQRIRRIQNIANVAKKGLKV